MTISLKSYLSLTSPLLICCRVGNLRNVNNPIYQPMKMVITRINMYMLHSCFACYEPAEKCIDHIITISWHKVTHLWPVIGFPQISQFTVAFSKNILWSNFGSLRKFTILMYINHLGISHTLTIYISCTSPEYHIHTTWVSHTPPGNLIHHLGISYTTWYLIHHLGISCTLLSI